MPGMIATTVLGGNLHRPGSPIFIGMVAVVVLLIVISVLLYKRGVLSSNEEE
jgi:uncharacterized membrane protein YdjX (TVP38/TMEM64 family)